MELRQLAAVAAVAERRSFSAAARQLNTVQSNVSTHVAHLERELGTTLVDRTDTSLTEAGRVAVAGYRRAQAELDAIVADINALHGEVSGSVRLGLIGTVGRWFMPVFLRSMAASYPRVRTVVVDATTTSLVPQLLDGRLDLAVVNLPLREPDLDVQVLFAEDHVVVAPAGHPLTRNPRTTLAELSAYPLLIEPPGTGFRDAIDADAAAAGHRLTASAEVDGMRLVASIAFEGSSIAVLPASAVPDPHRSGADEVDGPTGSGPVPWRRVEVDGFTPRRVGLARRRRGPASAAAAAVRDTVLEVVTAEGPRHPGLRLRAH